MGRRSIETTVPFLTAVYVYLLVPTALLFLAALLTSLLISHYDATLNDRCNERVRAFLFGCILIGYLWPLYHFAVLFGFRWKNLAAKLAVFALFLVAKILWLVFGHFTWHQQIEGQCFGGVYHFLLIANLAVLYIFIGYLLVLVAVAAAGACQVPGDPDYARFADTGRKHAGAAQIRVHTEGGEEQKQQAAGMSRRGGARIIATTATAAGPSPPASPHPLVELLPAEAPKSKSTAAAAALDEADALFLSKQQSLLQARSEEQLGELEQLELSVLGTQRGAHPNEAPSPSGLRRAEQSNVNSGPGQEATGEAHSPHRNPHRTGIPGQQMPMTPRMH